MRLLLINTILFFSLGLTAQHSLITNAYRIYEPDFKELIPFTQDQLEILKTQEIRTVEEIWQPKAKESSKVISYFNEKGLLTKQLTFNIDGKALTLIDSVIYRYDFEDRLILKQMNGEVFSSFDSISYDPESRITFYDSYSYNKYKGTVILDTNFVLRLKSLKKDTIILVEKSEPDYPIEYLFKNEELLKIESPFGMDSIVISYMDSIYWKKTYWFNNHINKNFQVGMIKLYKNNLLLKDSVMGMYNNQVGVINYHYNEQEQLMRTEGLVNETFIVYDRRGLISSKIVNHGGELYLTEFKYLYR